MSLIKNFPSLSDLVNRYKIESFVVNKVITVFSIGFFSKSLTTPESDPFLENDEIENSNKATIKKLNFNIIYFLKRTKQIYSYFRQNKKGVIILTFFKILTMLENEFY